jgi:glutamine cyclotransferase
MNMHRWGNGLPVVLAALLSAILATNSGCTASDTPAPDQVDSAAIVQPVILRTLAHDTAAFTQGLLFHDTLLYESTGLIGLSSLRVIDPASGVVKRYLPVAGVFAEGIAIKDNRLVQLTWQDQQAILYALPSLQSVGALPYAGEGWGLTSDGERFFMSNGTATLYLRDDSFAVVKELPVTCNGNPLANLNELEYARGRIYANVWFNDFIFEIDPRTGRVLRMVDCRALVHQAQVAASEDVLNGIAYNPGTGTFYLTGKNWRVMFEVRIPE